IIKESAKDFWIALKGLIARVGARRKAVPMDSLQLQIALEFEDGMLVNFVLTCLHARFVDDKAWVALIGEVRSQLDEQLFAVRAVLGPPDGQAFRRRSCVTIHVVVRGATAPVWFIGEPQPRE